MTEAEWLACTDPDAMWGHLHYSITSERKLPMFACACLRRIWHLFTDERCRTAVEVAERLADGLAMADDEFSAIHRAALDGWDDQARIADEGNENTPLLRAMPASGLAAYDAIDGDWQCVGHASDAVALFAAHHADPDWQTAKDEESRVQVRLLRCIFDNPFQPISISSAVLAWNDALVVRLAQVVYDERHLPSGTLDDSRLSILADALEEAGCSDAEVLGHLRGPGPHVRGCWPLDLCLGKS